MNKSTSLICVVLLGLESTEESTRYFPKSPTYEYGPRVPMQSGGSQGGEWDTRT